VGRAIVRALADAGAQVVAPSRDVARCDEYALELRGQGVKVEGARCDLASEQLNRAGQCVNCAWHRKIAQQRAPAANDSALKALIAMRGGRT
jgi:NAD(P)-dependent dehydrogenase (short-subunit alcohol dehydrogenase family)